MSTTVPSPARARSMTSLPTGLVHSLPLSTSRSHAARLCATGSKFSVTAAQHNCAAGAGGRPASGGGPGAPVSSARRGELAHGGGLVHARGGHHHHHRGVQAARPVLLDPLPAVVRPAVHEQLVHDVVGDGGERAL